MKFKIVGLGAMLELYFSFGHMYCNTQNKSILFWNYFRYKLTYRIFEYSNTTRITIMCHCWLWTKGIFFYRLSNLEVLICHMLLIWKCFKIWIPVDQFSDIYVISFKSWLTMVLWQLWRYEISSSNLWNPIVKFTIALKCRRTANAEAVRLA